jgi:NADPH:quinone reductase-like Zn-dependent oxidoreductase
MQILGETYDVIADTVGTFNFKTALPLLAEGGRFLAINGQVPDMLARPKGTRRCIAGPATEHVEDLKALVELAMAGRFKPLIDRVMDFEDLSAAHVLVDSGRKRGSVVLRVAA